jgi:hypothetical protein
MKKITLLIDDDVYKELVSMMSARIMTGSAYGIVDAFMSKVMEHIENGDTEAEIKYKDKK